MFFFGKIISYCYDFSTKPKTMFLSCWFEKAKDFSTTDSTRSDFMEEEKVLWPLDRFLKLGCYFFKNKSTLLLLKAIFKYREIGNI